MKKITALAAPLAIMLAACGGGGSSDASSPSSSTSSESRTSDEQRFIDAIHDDDFSGSEFGKWSDDAKLQAGKTFCGDIKDGTKWESAIMFLVKDVHMTPEQAGHFSGTTFATLCPDQYSNATTEPPSN